MIGHVTKILIDAGATPASAARAADLIERGAPVQVAALAIVIAPEKKKT